MNSAHWQPKAEWALCIAATVAAISLHVIYLTHAGGLWRDEAGTVQLGTLPTLHEMWRTVYRFDSFPALFPLVVRTWSGMFGGTDFALRCLGFLVALCLLGSVWWNAWVLGFKKPLFSIALLAVNLTVVRWGDSLRPYGLGTLFVMVSLGFVWSLAKAPSPLRFAGATLVAVASVQCFYQGAFLLLTICGATAIICFRCQQEKAAMAVLGVGAIAAVSLAPYASNLFGGQEWGAIERTGFDAETVFTNLWLAFASPMLWQGALWIVLVLFALAGGLLFLLPRAKKKNPGIEEVPLFSAMVIAFGLFAFLFALAIAKLMTQPWYWLPLLFPMAVSIDGVLANWPGKHRLWQVLPLAATVFIPLPAGVQLATFRQTNVDLAAARVAERAKPDDLIVVCPWYFGVTFHRYYKGQTPWTTLPVISDLRFHRYDLMKEKLAADQPIRDLLDRMGKTLAMGNKVWIVGKLPERPPEETSVPDLPPAPSTQYRWADGPYLYAWGRQVESFLALHSGRREIVATGAESKVNKYEDASVTGVWGLTVGTANLSY